MRTHAEPPVSLTGMSPGVVAAAAGGAIDPTVVASVRERVRDHLKQRGSLEGLDIEPLRPSPGTSFAFVAVTPTLKLKGDRTSWYRCSYCQTNDKFQEGRVVYCGDQKLRLIGNDCWWEHIEEEIYVAADRDYREYTRRETMTNVIDRLPTGIELLLSGLSEWVRALRSSFTFVDQLPELLRSFSPELLEELHKARQDDFRLSIRREVADYSSLEGKSGQRASAQPDVQVRQYHSEETIGRAAGLQALISRSNMMLSQVQLARHHLNNASTTLSRPGWEKLTDTGFNRRSKEAMDECRAALRVVGSLRERIRDVSRFFGRSNVELVARWASHPDNELILYGHFESAGDPNGGPFGRIRFTPDRGEPIELGPPAEFRRFRLAGLDELAKLLA